MLIAEQNAQPFDLLRTDRTYATRAAAVRVIERIAKKMTGRLPYIIATSEDGRFAPVVVGAEFAILAHHGITVVG